MGMMIQSGGQHRGEAPQILDVRESFWEELRVENTLGQLTGVHHPKKGHW